MMFSIIVNTFCVINSCPVDFNPAPHYALTVEIVLSYDTKFIAVDELALE